MLKRLVIFLTLLLVLVGAALAQDGTDTDGDTVIDDFDACPTDPGLPELSGCADDDGDGVPNPFDSCATEQGTQDNFGCPAGVTPDRDGDSVADQDDLCYLEPGTADFLGCTAESFPDFDGDTVADPLDACYEEVGLPGNSGCPEGVIPDLDLDGVPDAEDACPREYGLVEAAGCQPNSDDDDLPDFADACPEQAGSTDNFGCPEGVAPPDSDGDGAADLLDACPDVAGVSDLGGCPDSDSDQVPDNYDTCPDQTGTPELFGCVESISATLPGRAALTTANATGLTQLGQLFVEFPRIDTASNGTLAVRTSDRVLLYDTAVTELAPVSTLSGTGLAGYPVAVNGDASLVATVEFPADFTSPASALIRTLSGGVSASVSADDTEMSINELAFSPQLPYVAVGRMSGAGLVGEPSDVIIWDLTANAQLGVLPHPDAVINIAFSGDGLRLATDTVEGDSMVLIVWDALTQQQVVTIPTTRIIHFAGTPMALNADGSLVAFGKPDGTVSLYDVATGSEVWTVPVYDQTLGEIVSALDISPDGTLIAVAGGVPFSGGLTGQERFPVAVLDAQTGTQLAFIEGHDGLVTDIHFSADGSLVISAGDTTTRFWGVPQ